MPPVIEIENLRHSYGSRVAVDGLSLSVGSGQVFSLLGPNGSGKSTLFRILATLVRPQAGRVRLAGFDLPAEESLARAKLGVVFQSPAIDVVLTARENLTYHGRLYGLRGADLSDRVAATLAAVGLADRADERLARFSGGMRRRVELAKATLTRPTVLILDEPSTGLDAAARIDFRRHLTRLRAEGVTVFLTTHLMDEAAFADKVGILDAGRLVAFDAPAALTRQVGGQVIRIEARDPNAAANQLSSQHGLAAEVVGETVRLEHPAAAEMVPKIVQWLAGEVTAIRVSEPTLEDVFLRVTGRQFDTAA